MQIREYLIENIRRVLRDHLNLDVQVKDVQVNVTRPEFEGEYTLVVFPLAGKLKMSPPQAAERIGSELVAHLRIARYNVVQGFLNLTLNTDLWVEFLEFVRDTPSYGQLPDKNRSVLIEYSSPNTNKPLHLGHIRNILLGWSMYRILSTAGYSVLRTQIINDRGIAICKSMLAWEKWGQGATPESTGRKGDHFVGDFYVLFETNLREEYSQWQKTAAAQEVFHSGKGKDETEAAFFARYKNQYFNTQSALGKEARDMLIRWENNDEAVLDLWRRMNQWVYDGFDKTYADLGVEFDKIYYESETYILGKDIVEKGLAAGQFYRNDDGSVWVNLEDQGMDRKILQRSDGTSVYITQDLGTAEQRYHDLSVDRMVYVVADEQNYHFEVLFAICKLLDRPYADGMYHLSYGMVELPNGRMKSREGTVVDADDLMEDVRAEARKIALEKGEINDLPETEREDIITKIGLAALKYHMIRVQPPRRMVFDPAESVDMQGQTGPYIQNAYVRIQSILRKQEDGQASDFQSYKPATQEMDLLVHLCEYPTEIEKAATSYDPSTIANYAYKLAKLYHKFYNEHRVLSAESGEARNFRLHLCEAVAGVLAHSMNLLGIEMPHKM